MQSASPRKSRRSNVSKTLTNNHKEASTQTALNLEDLNTLLLAFLSPKHEACTQTEFRSDVSVMDQSCGRSEGDTIDDKIDTITIHNKTDTAAHDEINRVDKMDTVDDKTGTVDDKADTVDDKVDTVDDKVDTDLHTSLHVEMFQQHAIVKQEMTNENDDSDANFEPLSSSLELEDIELILTPGSSTTVKCERLTPTSMFSVPPSDRVTRSASKKKSTKCASRQSASRQTAVRRRLSARIDKRSVNRTIKEIQNGKLTAVVKLERVDDDDLETFMCPECGDSFALSSQLKRHAIEHTKDDDIFACDQCSDAFDTKRELTKHKNAKHRTNFFCDICSKRFVSNRCLVKHIRTHTDEKPYQCDTCDLAFADEIELLDHTCYENSQSNTTKSASKQPLHCIVCDKSFAGAYKLLRHYRSHTKEKPFECTKCPRAFSDHYDLTRHMKGHNPDDAPSSTPLNTTVDTKEVCELCGKVLRCRAHLIRHQMIHTGERPFPCEHCDKRFTELSGLKSHIARMHMKLEEKLHVCELCGKEFGILSHLNQHLKAHKKEKVKRERQQKAKPTCEICGKTFAQSYKLNVHMHTHAGTRPFQCEQCDKGFLHRHDYNRHMQYQHSIGNNESFARRYPCDKCPKVFHKAFHLKRHFMVRHSGVKNFACSICNKRYAMEEDLRQHVKLHNEGPFPCSVCGKLVATQRNLQRHLLTHEERPNTKIFKCVECNIGFFDQTELEKHNKCHLEHELCKCNFCETTFKMAADLKEHRITIHSKMSFPLNCEKCDKIFSTRYKILCHMKTHEKPLVCDLCGDRFSNQQVLRKHMITHTGIKPYVCEVCGKRFASPYHKKIHCRIHFEREFKCELCNKGFTEKRSLEKHANVHLRPHQCLHCEKRFATIYHLQHHAARHTGNRPCKCLECNKTFIDMADLNKHIKIHRKDRYACNKCKRYFNSETGLELHMKTHRFDTRFACSICHRKFKLQSHMEKHERRHAAPASSMMYSDPVYIESKVRTAASTCSLVKCCLCGKNYGLKDGDEPFICKVCEKKQTGEQSVIILAMDQAIKMEREDDDSSMLPIGGEMTVVTENQIPVSEMYTEQELFKCTICEKTFMLLENFLSHCEEHPEIEVTIETLETK